MNEEVLVKQLLNPLKRISPDSAYMSRSKQTIVFSRQETPVRPLYARFGSRLFEGATFTVGLALASLLLIVVLGSVSYSGPASTVATSLSNDSLALEAKLTDFSMQIKEVSYFDESAKQVALALDKISQTIDETADETSTPTQP